MSGLGAADQIQLTKRSWTLGREETKQLRRRKVNSCVGGDVLVLTILHT